MYQDTDQMSPTGLSTTLLLTDEQAAKVLGVSLQLVCQLIHEGELEAHRDEETGRWLIESSSVHARLKELHPELDAFDVSATTAADSDQDKRFFDYEYLLGLIDYDYLLVLMLMSMGVIMVAVAVDTIARAMLSGG